MKNENESNVTLAVSAFCVYAFDIARCQTLTDLDELVQAIAADTSLSSYELDSLCELINSKNFMCFRPAVKPCCLNVKELNVFFAVNHSTKAAATLIYGMTSHWSKTHATPPTQN